MLSLLLTNCVTLQLRFVCGQSVWCKCGLLPAFFFGQISTLVYLENRKCLLQCIVFVTKSAIRTHYECWRGLATWWYWLYDCDESSILSVSGAACVCAWHLMDYVTSTAFYSSLTCNSAVENFLSQSFHVLHSPRDAFFSYSKMRRSTVI